MSENMKFKRKVLSRKKIISSFLVVLVLSLCLGGFMYGLADSFEDFADIRILQIGFLVLFPLFTVIMWVRCVWAAVRFMICVRMHLSLFRHIRIVRNGI